MQAVVRMPASARSSSPSSRSNYSSRCLRVLSLSWLMLPLPVPSRPFLGVSLSA
jgi:hypothetical protein